MINPQPINNEIIHQWISEKLDVQTITEKLNALGWENETIVLHLTEFKKVKNAKKQMIGFICLASGSLLGFISCVLTLTNPIPEIQTLFLYGLTSLAIIIVFFGLYSIFE